MNTYLITTGYDEIKDPTAIFWSEEGLNPKQERELEKYFRGYEQFNILTTFFKEVDIKFESKSNQYIKYWIKGNYYFFYTGYCIERAPELHDRYLKWVADKFGLNILPFYEIHIDNSQEEDDDGYDED